MVIAKVVKRRIQRFRQASWHWCLEARIAGLLALKTALIILSLRSWHCYMQHVIRRYSELCIGVRTRNSVQDTVSWRARKMPNGCLSNLKTQRVSQIENLKKILMSWALECSTDGLQASWCRPSTHNDNLWIQAEQPTWWSFVYLECLHRCCSSVLCVCVNWCSKTNATGGSGLQTDTQKRLANQRASKQNITLDFSLSTPGNGPVVEHPTESYSLIWAKFFEQSLLPASVFPCFLGTARELAAAARIEIWTVLQSGTLCNDSFYMQSKHRPAAMQLRKPSVAIETIACLLMVFQKVSRRRPTNC